MVEQFLSEDKPAIRKQSATVSMELDRFHQNLHTMPTFEIQTIATFHVWDSGIGLVVDEQFCIYLHFVDANFKVTFLRTTYIFFHFMDLVQHAVHYV